MRVLTPLAALLIMLIGGAEASAGLQSALRTYYWGRPVANYNPRTGNITLTNVETFGTAATAISAQIGSERVAI